MYGRRNNRVSETLHSKARAIAFTRAVINAGFLVPLGPQDAVAALHATNFEWVSPQTRSLGYGYVSNITARELDSVVARY